MFNVIFVAVKQGIVCSTFNRHTCIIDAYDAEWNWQIFGLKLFSTGEIFNKYNIVLFVLILLSFDGLAGTFVNILAMLCLAFLLFQPVYMKGDVERELALYLSRNRKSAGGTPVAT